MERRFSWMPGVIDMSVQKDDAGTGFKTPMVFHCECVELGGPRDVEITSRFHSICLQMVKQDFLTHLAQTSKKQSYRTLIVSFRNGGWFLPHKMICCIFYGLSGKFSILDIIPYFQFDSLSSSEVLILGVISNYNFQFHKNQKITTKFSKSGFL